MAEGRALGAEADLLPRQLPALARHRPGELPAAAALLVRTGDELAVRLPVVAGGRPERLRLGADETVLAVTFELPAMAAVDEAVIGPRLGDERVRPHAARTAGMPIVALALGPASIAAPAARTCVQGHRLQLGHHLGGLDEPSVDRRAGGRHSRPGPRSFRAT